MDRAKERKDRRVRVRSRVRRKIRGTEQRPRLAVYKSLNHIYAQAIDDIQGVTVAAASSREKDLSVKGANVETAKKVGEIVGKRLKEKGVDAVVFDRSGYIYHGRVKALAEAAREQGLKF